LEDRVRQLERELTTEYKNVDEDFIKSQLKLKTDEMAYDDLDKYSKALDKSVNKSFIIIYYSLFFLLYYNYLLNLFIHLNIF